MNESQQADQDQNRFSIIYAVHDQIDSTASFAHALGLAYASRGDIEIVDVRKHKPEESAVGVRTLFERWGILPEGSERDEVSHLGLRVKKITRIGDSRAEIGKRLLRHQHDLLVIGTAQRRGLRALFGQDLADQLAQSFRQTTLFVPQNARPFVDPDTGVIQLERILAPVAEAPSIEPGLDLLRKILGFLPSSNPSVTGLHIGPQFPFISASRLEGVSWNEELLEGPVAASIIEAAERMQADLVLMTTNGRDTLSQRVVGSVTEQVLKSVRCPVLAVSIRS